MFNCFLQQIHVLLEEKRLAEEENATLRKQLRFLADLLKKNQGNATNREADKMESEKTQQKVRNEE